jgi:formate dehydrogenase alpha subunit
VETITITLDGMPVSGRQGMTILELARQMGISIPTLCHDACLKPVGACRICLVEEEATGRLLASCVTPIAPGMQIQTQSPAVLDTRKVVLQLLMANHAESCLVCDKGNRCRLRQLAAEMGIGLIDYDRMPPRVETQDLNPFISRDLNKCILCAKCIRADHELVVVGALDYLHRGFDALPATLFEGPLEQSECTFCGTCVALCPTGALSEKIPDFRGSLGRRLATTCSYCGCGCALWVHSHEDRLVQVTPKAENSPNQATLCVRGHYGSDYLNHPQRLQQPLVRGNGDMEAASWEEALDQTAQRLRDIARQWGPEAIGFYGSTQCSNEENYLFQKLARQAIGSAHVDNGARLQAASSLLGLKEVLGVGAATNPMEDLETAQVILLIGAQPTESHPVAGYHIKRAVRYRGARLIYVGPVEDALSLMAEPRLRIEPGSEMAVILGLIRILAREHPDLLRSNAAAKMLDEVADRVDPDSVETLAGVPFAILREVAATLAATRRCALVFGAGISQSSGALDKVRGLAYLGVLLGCLGVSGGGVYPLDKGANTQGACDMGTLTEWLPGQQSVSDPHARERLARIWGGELPGAGGWRFPEMLEAARRGQLKALYVLGENPAAVLPAQAQDALDRLEFLVVQDLFMTDTARRAHVVLPGAGFAEKDGTYTSLERRIQRLRCAVKPPGEARADWWILSEILRRMNETEGYESASDVMKEIATVVPGYGGVQYSRLESGGLFWPCPDPDSLGEPILHRGGVENLGTGWQIQGLTLGLTRHADRPWLAVRGETHFHFGGGTRSSRSPRLYRMAGQCRVHLHPDDVQSLSVSDGRLVRLVSDSGSMEARVLEGSHVPPGMALVVPGPHWGAMGGLMDGSWDPVTRMPQLYVASVRIEPVGGEG